VRKLTTIPLIALTEDASPSPVGTPLEPMSALTRFAVADPGQPLTAATPGGEILRGFGKYQYLIRTTPATTADLVTMLRSISAQTGVGHHSTELFEPVQPRLSVDNPRLPEPPVLRDTTPPSASPVTDVRTPPERKLRALQRSIITLRNTPHFDNMIPQDLPDSLDRILSLYEDGELQRSALLYFISEIQDALDERIAGAELDPMEPLPPILRHAAGVQRLISACETMLALAYEFSTDQMFNDARNPLATDVKTPIILCFFDYNPAAPPRPPPDFHTHAAAAQLPIVVRMPLLRYKPWLWPLGLASLAEFVVPRLTSPASRPPLGIESAPLSTLEIDRFVDRFMFITRANYAELLSHHLNVVAPDGDTGYIVRRLGEKYIQRRIGNLAGAAERVDPHLIDKYSAYLRKGAVIGSLGVDYVHFTAFLNAYAALPPAERMSARCTSSFVMSLNKTPLRS
jgi:hypothetical protein